jgi:hypothetical protein
VGGSPARADERLEVQFLAVFALADFLQALAPAPGVPRPSQAMVARKQAFAVGPQGGNAYTRRRWRHGRSVRSEDQGIRTNGAGEAVTSRGSAHHTASINGL